MPSPAALSLEGKCLWRLLRRQWVSTATAVAGTALSVALLSGLVVVASVIFDPKVAGTSISGDPYSVFTRSTAEAFHFGVDRDTIEGMQRALPGFEHILAASYPVPVSLSDGGKDESIKVEIVNPGFFPGLGVSAVAGRLELGEMVEHTPCVVSTGLARRLFGSAVEAVGRRVQVSGQDCRVTGVAAPDFAGLWSSGIDLWWPWHRVQGLAVPLDETESAARRIHLYSVVALAPANDKAAPSAFERYRQEQGYNRPPLDDIVMVPGITRLPDARAEAGSGFWLHGLACVLLFLVALVNVGSFTAMMAMERAADDPVRSALGIPADVQAWMEVAPAPLILGIGAVSGALLAGVVERVMLADPAVQEALAGAALDQDGRAIWVWGVSAAVLVLGSVIHAVVVRTARGRMARRGQSSIGRAGKRSTQAVAGGQVLVALLAAVAAVVLVGAHHAHLKRLDPERYDMVQMVSFALKPGRFLAGSGFFDDSFRERVTQAMTTAGLGAEAVAFATRLPFDGAAARLSPFTLIGETGEVASNGASAQFNEVSAHFFAAAGIPLLAGRLPEPGADREVAVSRSLASTLSTGEPKALLGRRIASSLGLRYQVVAVVEDLAYDSPQGEPTPTLYRPLQGAHLAGQALLRTTLSGHGVRDLMSQALAPGHFPATVGPVRNLAGQMHAIRAPHVARASMVSASALAALLLAIVGVQAASRFSLYRELRALSIRAALGAGTPRLLWRSIRFLAWLGMPAIVLATAVVVSLRGVWPELASVPLIVPMGWGLACAVLILLLAVLIVVLEFLRLQRRHPISRLLAGA